MKKKKKNKKFWAFFFFILTCVGGWLAEKIISKILDKTIGDPVDVALEYSFNATKEYLEKKKSEKVSTVQLAEPVKNEIVLPPVTNSNKDKIITVYRPNQYWLLINKSQYLLSLLKGEKIIKQYPVAVGKNKGDKRYIGDNRTPVGKFKIVSIENSSTWTHDFHDGRGAIAGAYGPYFLRLDANGWPDIGIHGTHEPDARGTDITEGSIWLCNEGIAELKFYAYRNMPVEIIE
ncbi:MAG: L,D-transpeptidase [Synergistaceae bacterium]|nr:L,D-transpeptidase [Synergistaceae bacterium]